MVSSIYSGSRIFCPNAERVVVHNGDSLLCFDRVSRRLVWRSQVAKPVVLSVGGDYFAHHPAGLVFYSGRDGLPTPWLPMHVGASTLAFEPAAGGERPPRLAALIEADNDYGAEPGVHVYDGGEFVWRRRLVASVIERRLRLRGVGLVAGRQPLRLSDKRGFTRGVAHRRGAARGLRHTSSTSSATSLARVWCGRWTTEWWSRARRH